MARWLVACPKARSKTRKNPIGAYQQEVLYLRRFVLIVLGLVVALVVLCIRKAFGALLETKLEFVIDLERSGTAFGSFLGFNLLFASIAVLPVLYRPVSGGSGIAEAKAILNGTCRQNRRPAACPDLPHIVFFCFFPFVVVAVFVCLPQESFCRPAPTCRRPCAGR